MRVSALVARASCSIAKSTLATTTSPAWAGRLPECEPRIFSAIVAPIVPSFGRASILQWFLDDFPGLLFGFGTQMWYQSGLPIPLLQNVSSTEKFPHSL